MYTLSHLLEEKAKKNTNKPFLLYEESVITYEEFNRTTEKLVNGLLDLGVRQGNGIAVMMGNSPEFLYLFFAIQKIGAYFVPVNTSLKRDGLAYILKHSDVSFFCTDAEIVDRYIDIRDKLNDLKYVIINGERDDIKSCMPADVVFFSELFKCQDKKYKNKVNKRNLSTIIYTSGTTGLPKGVVKRYNSYNWKYLNKRSKSLRNEVLYTCLPLFHGNALRLTVVRGLLGDATVALSKRFSASKFWDEIKKYSATSFNALGAMIPILMKQPEKEDDSDNTVKTVISAACPPEIIENFERRFNLKVIESYG
ncbi:AMP-binding protein, partial [Elusimicrobiota bacterium]